MGERLKFESQVLKVTDKYPEDFYLPDFPRDENGKISREKMLEILLSEEYGYTDDDGIVFSQEIIETNEKQFAGKCRHSVILFKADKGDKHAEFKVNLFTPYKRKNAPFIVFPNFRPDIPDKGFPVEELMDAGVSVAQFCYNDVSKDRVDDFSDSYAALLRNESKPHPAGKIAIWAYAAGLVGKYAKENGLASSGLYVAGHSRLGKTALLAAAVYEIFDGVLSNCSGCCGAAISRGKSGETLKDINNVFRFWFTDEFKKHVEREYEMPFDQHFLLGAIAPRKICIVTAKEDEWADTDAQYLCAEAASAAYAELRIKGLASKSYIKDGQHSMNGNIAFCKREGTHFFSRSDWAFFINFIK